MKRREFLKSSLACLTFASFAEVPTVQAIGPGQRFRLVRIRHQGGWDTHHGAVSSFAREFSLRSSVDVDPNVPGVSLSDPEFLRHPMAVLIGDRDFSFTEKERNHLKRWIEMGGFLLVDNAGRHKQSDAFEKAVRREFESMFPRRAFSRVSPDHVIYRTFYRLDYPAGRAIHKPYIDGIVLGKRVAVILNHNDLFGAFAPAGLGRYKLVPQPGGESQREIAMRFAVNIALYGLCLHYKDDQVHLDYLLHRRKWKVRRPR